MTHWDSLKNGDEESKKWTFTPTLVVGTSR